MSNNSTGDDTIVSLKCTPQLGANQQKNMVLMAEPEYKHVLSELSRQQMLLILETFGNDALVCERITELATKYLAQLDEEVLADLLVERLNAIDVVDLWESSGDGYCGYDDPVDVANRMLNDVIQPFRDEMLKHRRLGF